MADLSTVCKAGCAGCSAIALVVLGVVLLFPGLTLLLVGATGTSDDNEDVYEDQNTELLWAGGVLLVFGFLFVVGGIFLCVYACRKVSQSSTRSGGMVLSTNPSQTAAVVSTTQYAPVPASTQQYPPQTSHQYPNQYPTGNQPYPAQYPTSNQQYAPQYPASQQQQHSQYTPQYQHAHTQQAPAPYRNDNLPYNPAYPPAVNPNVSSYSNDQPSNTKSPSAPPVHQMSLKR